MYKVLFEGKHTIQKINGNTVVDPCFAAASYIETDGKKLIFDPGARGMEKTLLEELNTLGLKPADIDYVLNSHFHYDHTYNNYLFPHAPIFTVVTQWLPNRADAADDLEAVLGLEHLKIMHTPGHTPDHMVAILEEDGQNIVFAGDAVNEDIFRSKEIPEVYFDPYMYVNSAIAVLDVADILVPGHGPVLNRTQILDLKQFLEENY